MKCGRGKEREKSWEGRRRRRGGRGGELGMEKEERRWYRRVDIRLMGPELSGPE